MVELVFQEADEFSDGHAEVEASVNMDLHFFTKAPEVVNIYMNIKYSFLILNLLK